MYTLNHSAFYTISKAKIKMVKIFLIITILKNIGRNNQRASNRTNMA